MGCPGFFAPNTPAIFFRINRVQVHHGKGTRVPGKRMAPVFSTAGTPLIFFEIDRVLCCTGKGAPGNQGTVGCIISQNTPHIVKIFKNGKILKGVK